jgi:heme/copper-type cytochrome/quinol oxidase subunit 2
MSLAHPLGCLAGAALAGLFAGGVASAAPAAPAKGGVAQSGDTASSRSFTIAARKYAYAPARIEVAEGDLVKIVLRSDDIAHSFTIDAYRIARRVAPGGTTMFEFRADKSGTFTFYCNLSSDDGCRAMRGELVVRPRR